MASKIAIRRHVAIKGKANPYDSAFESYFEMRAERIMREKLKGRRKLNTLYERQKGICLHCRERITDETGWHVHHVISKFLGGKDTYDNLVLLHPICHHQIHHRIGYRRRVDKGV